MEKETRDRYEYWLKSLKDINNEDYLKLKSIKDESKINDLFYKDLSFGTGGLRGIMDLGSSRLNVYNIYRASEGLALYLLEKFKDNKDDIKVVIGYDSRFNSKEFSEVSARVFASNKIKVYLFKEISPTPLVSFAIRRLRAKAGVMITASHNPREYNGYKVYNENAYQITLNEASEIIKKINEVDTFLDFKKHTSKNYINNSLITYVDDDISEEFIKSNLNSSILKDKCNKDELKIIYTPLNGTGRKYVPKALKEDGFNNIIIVKEQEESDPNFTTCPKPNPELKEALSLGISYLNKFDASILIATDPDADRCGVVIKTKENKIYLPSGNEIALLLLNFIIEYNLNYLHKDISYFKDKIVVRSIVSTSLVDKICFKYNIKLKTVLTGFKFIGEEINNLELNNKLDSYLIGFEESYGYLTNTDIRDKDSINASILISEMTYFYKELGLDLVDKLDLIYKEYGYYKNILLTHNFLGEDGMNKMKKIMNNLRELNLNELSNLLKEEVKSKEDYLLSKEININNEIKDLSLPKSDVLIINFKNNTRFMIRPSGTEPKLKCYIEVSSKSEEESNNLINKFKELFNVIIK